MVQERQTYWVAKSLATLTDNSDDGTGNGSGEPNGPIVSYAIIELISSYAVQCTCNYSLMLVVTILQFLNHNCFYK